MLSTITATDIHFLETKADVGRVVIDFDAQQAIGCQQYQMNGKIQQAWPNHARRLLTDN